MAGILSVSSYSQTSTGSLTVPIASNIVGSGYGQLASANGVSLAGKLVIKRKSSYVPPIGDTFTIVTGNPITGQFASPILKINLKEHFQINYTPTRSHAQGRARTVIQRLVCASSATASTKAFSHSPSAKNPPALYVSADANYVMGEVERAIAVRSAADQQRQHWIEARDWYQKSQDAWRRISSPGAVSPAGYLCGNPREVANAIVLCDRALRNGSRQHLTQWYWQHVAQKRRERDDPGPCVQ